MSDLGPLFEELVDDSDSEDNNDIDERVETYLAQTRRDIRLREPTDCNADKYLRERDAERRAERRQVRKDGRAMQIPDARGVRGEQYAPVPDAEAQIALLRQGRISLLSPYHKESGIDREQVMMSTSWVDNAKFDISLTSSGPSIFIPDAPASRHVSPADEFIAGTFDSNGVPDNGGEYAVFAYKLTATERIRSAPAQVIEIDINAAYTHGNTKVQKRLRAKALGLVLDMRDIHPVLMTNSDNGRPVTTPDGAVVRKSGEALPFAPTASIFKRPARYTFRYKPSERHWMLTRVDFALKRTALQGIADGKQTIYFDPRWSIAGEPLNQRQVTLVQVENPASNPLDPEVFLEVFPLRSDTSISGLPLLAGQSHRVEIRATHKLVPRKLLNQAGTANSTQYTELPSLEVFLPDVAEILRHAPRDVESFTVDVSRASKERRDEFTSSENSLHDAPLRLLVRPSVELDAVFELVSLQIGPIRQSALYEAIADSSSRI